MPSILFTTRCFSHILNVSVARTNAMKMSIRNMCQIENSTWYESVCFLCFLLLACLLSGIGGISSKSMQRNRFTVAQTPLCKSTRINLFGVERFFWNYLHLGHKTLWWDEFMTKLSFQPLLIDRWPMITILNSIIIEWLTRYRTFGCILIISSSSSESVPATSSPSFSWLGVAPILTVLS